MKGYSLVALVLLAGSEWSGAQLTTVTTDVIGAHLNYGRGCAACHAPHNGAAGNGSARTPDVDGANAGLWGQEAGGLYGKTITTGGGRYVEVLPASSSATTPDVAGMLTCLTCHDGNIASSAMMKGQIYETLPATYGAANKVPTLLGSGAAGGSYLNDHPVGLSATVSCGGGSGWDCAQVNGVITMSGANSSRFVKSYGYFVKPATYNNTSVVVCTTCHEPHMMNACTVTNGSTSGLPSGTYTTMFFLRGPYNPSDTNPNSNQTAQFCRQCHAKYSNEVNGSSAGTIF